MAILFGCDYLPEGVPGVRKDPAIRKSKIKNKIYLKQNINPNFCLFKLGVLSTWENGRAQEIVKSWLFENYSDEIPPPRPAHCSQCKHPGSLRNHVKYVLYLLYLISNS